MFKLNVEVCQVDKKKNPFLVEKNITYKGENKEKVLVSSKSCNLFDLAGVRWERRKVNLESEARADLCYAILRSFNSALSAKQANERLE